MEQYEIVVDDEGNYCGLIPSENGPLVRYADAHATIADLQGQAKDYQACRDVLDSTVLELTQVQQRVAQLEGLNEHLRQQRSAYIATIDDLQADLARVLGLVQDVVNAGVSMEDPRIAYKEVQIDREWFDRAAASLPAQRAKLAQGGV